MTEAGRDDPTAERMARAAAAWLDSLSPAQRGPAWWSRIDSNDEVEAERTSWFYTPTDHGGLPLGAQRPRQQQLAMMLLATGTSAEGYAAISSIIGLENVLDRVENFSIQWDRERGRDPGLYYLRVFGVPGPRGTWGWRLGGHHVSVNCLIVDDVLVSVTPFFLGADPASTRLPGGDFLRPLGAVERLARALVRSLDTEQLESAMLLDRAVSDIVTGNRRTLRDGDEMIHMQDLWRGRFSSPELARLVDDIDERAERASGFDAVDHRRLAFTARPKGIGADRLSDPQRERFRELIAAVTAGPVDFAAPEDHLDRDGLRFAWAGSTEQGRPVYFRIQGPGLLFEYDNTQRDANHAHSVLRDPGRDFGLNVLRGHRDRYHRDSGAAEPSRRPQSPTGRYSDADR